MALPAPDPFAVSPEQLAAANAAMAGQAPASPDPGAIPPALLAGPGAGTILPPSTGPGDAEDVFTHGLMAQRPNQVVAVPPPPGQAPLLGPNQQPLAPPALPTATTPPTVRPTGGGGRGGKPDELGKLDQALTAAGDKEAQGIKDVQQAKVEGAEAVTNALGDLSVEQRMDAQELADKQKETREKQAKLDQQDAANLQKARDYVIPDFWQGHEGARVGSIISIAMGNIASAITGGPNGALQIMNKNVDDYMYKQKEKVDNLYKYAEQTGRLNDKTRLQYAQELVDLKDQHVAIQQSILTRIKAVEASNTGNVERAATNQMLGVLEQNIAKERKQNQLDRAHIIEMQSVAAKNYAEAGKAKAEAARARVGTDDKADEAATKAYATPLIKTADELNRRVNSLKDAQVGLKDPKSSSGEVIAAIESGISANSGAGVRGVSMGQLHSIIPNLVSADGRISDIVSQQWNGKAGQEFRTVGMRFVQRAIDSRIAEQRENRKNAATYLGNTPYGKRAPDFAERTAERLYPGLGQASGPAPQQSQSIPVGARSTSGGKPIVMTANGWAYAQ